MGSVLLASLQAQGRFLSLNLVQGLGGVGLLLAPWLVAVTSEPELPAALAAVVSVRAAMLVVLWGLHPRDRRPTWHACGNRDELRALLRFGGWASVSAAVGPLMVVLDRFVIGHQLGVRAVPTYAIPFQLAEKTTLLSSAISHALFPQLASAASAQQRQELACRALGLLAMASAPPVAVGIWLCGPFLAWWLPGNMGVDGTRVAQWLLFGFWLNGLALVPLTLLYASGRPAVVARCHLIEVAPYLLLLMFAVREAGLVGAAAAFTARALADLLMLAWGASMLSHSASRALFWGLVIAAAALAAAAPASPLGVTSMVIAGAMIAGQTVYAGRRLFQKD
jgi:O-antigen/teichoic acid export membrane protein